MVTRVEPRSALVDEEGDELGACDRTTLYDATSICTMDVVEEHRYHPPSHFADPAPEAPRPRSPSVYSMFVTDHSHSEARSVRCKNPSVYSMPIAAFRARRSPEDDDMDDLGAAADMDDSGSSSDAADDEDDADDRVFMTRRSRRVANRNTDTHSHMNFRPRCKNPSVYSMPILGSNRREGEPPSSTSSRQMRTLRVAPLVPLPFAESTSSATEVKDDGEEYANHYPEDDDDPRAAQPEAACPHPPRRLKRAASRRVQPSLKDNIATGFTSCRGRTNDDNLPPSYHVTVCVGILGVLFFFGGLAMTIVGFNSADLQATDSSKALKALGPIVLGLGFIMCAGCFMYLCVVYTRYKRLSAYLKRRNSARLSRAASSVSAQAQPEVTSQSDAADPNRVQRIHHSPEAAAEDIRQMLATLQTGGSIAPTDPMMDRLSQSGDTPL